jgi:C1A family cysteine protease
MRTIAALALVAAANASTEMESAFMSYISSFEKSYPTIEEFNHRFEQFARNHANIETHNASGAFTFTLGHNQFSDWTEEEYKAILTYTPVDTTEMEFEDFDANEINGAIDWRSKGAVQSIKDQGQCGSCWAFSTMSAMESSHQIKSGKLLSLSEQQLVDCSTSNHGCNGGNASLAFSYLSSKAAMSESSYPYTHRNGTCKWSSNNTGVVSTSHSYVTSNSPSAMKSALANQPLSVAIEADKSVFQSYKSGIFNSTACGTSLDHATNVVGWGSSAGTDYWIMRNSWGTSWGEKGYMRLAIVSGKGNCGIQMQPLYTKTN